MTTHSLIRKLRAVGLVLATAAAVSLSAPRPASAAATYPYGVAPFVTDLQFLTGPGAATTSVAAWVTLISTSVQAQVVNKRVVASFYGSLHATYTEPYVVPCQMAFFLDGSQVGPLSQATVPASAGTAGYVALGGTVNAKIVGGGSGGGWHSLTLQIYSAAGCTAEINSVGLQYSLFEDAPSGVFGP